MEISYVRLALSFLLMIMLAGCAQAEEEREERPVDVIAQRIEMLPDEQIVEAIGSARAVRSAAVFAETAGRVTAVRFSPGDFVQRGAPLVQLDARQERLALDLANVRVEEAAQLLARYRRIEDTGAISDSQIEAGETALAAARVERDQAREALADRTVRAPFSGHIGFTEIDTGDRVTPDVEIAQLDQRGTLYVDFPAPETVFQRLRPGQEVDVVPFSAPDTRISARIRAVDSAVSTDGRTYQVRTSIDNEGDDYRPGMSFRVRYRDFGVTRPAVPEAAVIWGGEGSYVWSVREGEAVRVPVTITSRSDGVVLLDAPLERGDLVIVEGVQKVRDGQAVNLVQPTRIEAPDVTVEPSANAS
ncbi:efflux RND transporter periplasmic adaptor subunit [Sphingomicrobium sp. XHP0239]|uniref:efflux RND transporter periplasmic adaptor subunit n=1 Tax=Sphingomicrobium maritimum TaxID=3133972 RepID=UPI0031CC8ECC